MEPIDGTDRRILDALQRDGRISNVSLAEEVNLSPSPCLRRLKRLEENGVIAGYRAVLDHAKLGSQIEAFIELRFAGATQVDDIEGAVAGLPEVVEAFTTAGDPDALVRLRATDLDHLKRVVDRIRRTGKVTGTKTLIVLGSARHR
jgi:Lrp/AsnC family transcriptional regulator, leucine-responsive regulatory protein